MTASNETMEPHDFEMISPADIDDQEQPDAMKSADNAAVQEQVPEKSVRELFDNQYELGQVIIVPTLAKAIILASLPLLIYWIAVSAIVSSIYRSGRAFDPASNAQILESVSVRTQGAIEASRRRFKWVDEELPSAMKKHFEPDLTTFDNVPPSKLEKAEGDVARPDLVAAICIGPLLNLIFCSTPWWTCLLTIWLSLGMIVGCEKWIEQKKAQEKARHDVE